MILKLENGSTVEVAEVAGGFDLHLRNAEGESIATVVALDPPALVAMIAPPTNFSR